MLNQYFDFDKNILSLNLNQTNISHIESAALRVHEETQVIAYNVTNSFEHKLIRNRFTDNKTCVVICSKDNGIVIGYVLSILVKYNIHKKYDILLVDDRSKSDSILNLSDKYNLSYLRIDNKHNTFNYSVINNIAVSYLKKLNKEHAIFYNNDLWPTSENTIDNLVQKHNSLGSHISGCKLLYPTQDEYENLGKPNHVLNEHLSAAYGTIQHGGIFFAHRTSPIKNNLPVLAPCHTWRFYESNTTMASIDIRCFAVTGAIQIINIDTFIDLGGFSINFASSFQDIDLCLRAIEKGLSIFYLGSETMIHAESLTIANEKKSYNDNLLQDNILWDIIWGQKLLNLLGMHKNNNA